MAKGAAITIWRLKPLTNQIVHRNIGKPRFRVKIFCLLTIHPDVRLGVQGR